MVPFFREALEMVLDVETGGPRGPRRPLIMRSRRCADEDSSKIPDVSIVEASAEVLYGLVHQRYIITRSGLQAMVSPAPLRAPCAHATPRGRQTSTRTGCSARVHACTARAQMSSRAGGTTCPGWTP
jgi:hypothetical protein